MYIADSSISMACEWAHVFLSVRVGVSCAEVGCKRSQDDMDVQLPLGCRV
jgi:hypothetical protein